MSDLLSAYGGGQQAVSSQISDVALLYEAWAVALRAAEEAKSREREAFGAWLYASRAAYAATVSQRKSEGES